MYHPTDSVAWTRSRSPRLQHATSLTDARPISVGKAAEGSLVPNFILWRYTKRRMWQGAVDKVDRCHQFICGQKVALPVHDLIAQSIAVLQPPGCFLLTLRNFMSSSLLARLDINKKHCVIVLWCWNPQVFKNMSLRFWEDKPTHVNSMDKLNSCCFCIGKFPCKEWRNLVQMTHHILRYGKNLGIFWKLWTWNDLLLFQCQKISLIGWLVGVFGLAQICGESQVKVFFLTKGMRTKPFFLDKKMQPGVKQVIRHASTEHVFNECFYLGKSGYIYIYIYISLIIYIYLDTHKYILISPRIQDPPLE